MSPSCFPEATLSPHISRIDLRLNGGGGGGGGGGLESLLRSAVEPFLELSSFLRARSALRSRRSEQEPHWSVRFMMVQESDGPAPGAVQMIHSRSSVVLQRFVSVSMEARSFTVLANLCKRSRCQNKCQMSKY